MQERITVIHATLEEDGTLKSSESMNFEAKNFDIIVSNPPYVPTKDILKLEPEIKMYVILKFRSSRFKNGYTFVFCSFFSCLLLFIFSQIYAVTRI